MINFNEELSSLRHPAISTSDCLRFTANKMDYRDVSRSDPAGSSRIDNASGHETILIAEDEPGIRMLFSTFLAQLGYRVLTAEDGEEAKRIAAAHSGRIDLLISDIVMPKLGGWRLTADLQAQYPGLKVLIMSGYAGDNESQNALQETQARVVQKPFPSMQFLAQVVRETLDGDQAESLGK